MSRAPKNRELLTDDDVHALLLEALERAGGVSQFALVAGVAPSAVSVIKNRHVVMNGRVAKALGIERVRLWTRVRVDDGDLIAEHKNQPRISARTASAAPRRTPRSQSTPDEASAVPAAVSRLSP